MWENINDNSTTLRNQAAEQFVSELENRGLIKDISDRNRIVSILSANGEVYFGIDPTASFLHLGHYLGLSLIKRFTNHGYKFVLIIGGVTSQIGDPSFRKLERDLNLDIEDNIDHITKFLQDFFAEDIKKGLLTIVNNYQLHNDYLLTHTPYLQEKPLDLIIHFCKDICGCISVNSLIEKDFLQDRMQEGLTVSELLYSIIQGWDFLRLYHDHNVRIQIGGSDQWGNIVQGLRLVSKSIGNENDYVDIAGFTFPLLEDSDGNKFGKSDGNAISITGPKSEYLVYQYLIDSADSKIEEYLLLLTSLPISEIQSICNQDIRRAKQMLAIEVCRDIFGKEKSDRSKQISDEVFGLTLNRRNYETLRNWYETVPSHSRLWQEGISVAVLFIEVGLVSSNSEFRRLCGSGGIYVEGVDDELIREGSYGLKYSDVSWNPNPTLKDGYIGIRKGKKQYGVIKFVQIES